jgi:hypothetical protein
MKRGSRTFLFQSRYIALARNYGVGLEETFAFDQDEAKLELLFADGRKLVASAQLIGSFDPRDHSFMWAWANPSVDARLVKAAEAARSEGERLVAAALTTPTQSACFDDLVPLIAFVARRYGAEGLYRCIVNNSTSLFMAIDVDLGLLREQIVHDRRPRVFGFVILGERDNGLDQSVRVFAIGHRMHERTVDFQNVEGEFAQMPEA